MAEGGGLPWSSRRRKSRRRERDRDSIENSNDDIESDLLRVVLSDSEDFVPDDVKSTASVACSCDSDFQDEQASLNVSCEDKSSLDFVDLDPEVRRRAQIQSLGRFPNKVTPPKRSKSRKNSPEEICGYDRGESGLGYYGRRLQEAKRARHKAEKDAKNRRIQDESKTPRRRRPLSMVSSRTGNNDAEFFETRRRRFSFSWGFRRVSTDTNLEDAVEDPDISENGENLQRSSSTALRARQDNQSQSSGMNFEEFHRQKREKARLKAAQHRLEYFLIKDIVSITNCPWYWGKINRFQAEKVRNLFCTSRTIGLLYLPLFLHLEASTLLSLYIFIVLRCSSCFICKRLNFFNSRKIISRKAKNQLLRNYGCFFLPCWRSYQIFGINFANRVSQNYGTQISYSRRNIIEFKDNIDTLTLRNVIV